MQPFQLLCSQHQEYVCARVHVVLIPQIGYYSLYEYVYYHMIKITVCLSPHVDWSV